MIVYTLIIFASGFAGGIAAALLLAACRAAAREVPRETIDTIAARDERALSPSPCPNCDLFKHPCRQHSI